MKKNNNISETLQILSLEDSPPDLEIMRELLIDSGLDFDIVCTAEEKEFTDLLRSRTYDIILADFRLPGFDAFAALKCTMDICPEVPFICVSGSIGEETAVELLKKGAVDYILKDRLERLPAAIKRAREEAKEKEARRQVEVALVESDARLRESQKLGRIGSWEFDIEKQTIFWSDETYFLYERDPALGPPTSDEEALYYSPETDKKLKDYAAQSIESGIELSYDLTVVLPSGKITWFSTIIHPYRNTNGRVVKLLGTVQDITERKRVEDSLRENEERLRAIFDNATDGILLTNLENNTIYSANNSMAHMLGYSLEELTKLKAADIHPKEALPYVLEGIQSQAKDKLTPARDLPMKRKDGSVFYANVHGAPVVLSGKKYLLGIFRDITERKLAEEAREKLEEQLRVSQKMEAIGSLAGGIAHDFNNMLTVILSFTGFALDGIREGDPVRDDLFEVKKAGERAAALTRQLLAFGRRQIMELRPLDLNGVIAGIEKMMRRIISEDVVLETALAQDLYLTLADPGQIEQVIMNLAINARDAMPEGGKLTIETVNTELDEEYAAAHEGVKPGSYVSLVVSDTGCGMDDETKSRIFEPFFTTKETGKGTGLGLSTVYGIVKQCDGNIWVYSEPGRGATFKVYLPRCSGAAATAPIVPVSGIRKAGTETILVVEDEEAVRMIASRVLGSAGYTVITAANGDEAVGTCESYKGDIHLLLTDMVMPGIDGKKLADRLIAIRPGLKVLFMSGYTATVIVNRGVLEPETRFIGKPFTAEDLSRKVREALEGNERG